MKRTLGILVVSLVAIVAAGFFGLRPQQRILAAADHPSIGAIKIVGETQAAIFPWEVTLCWRRPGGPWMRYPLDHEARPWRDFQITFGDDFIRAARPNGPVGQIAVGDGSYLLNGNSFKHPTEVLRAEAPWRNNAHAVFPDAPAWKEVWPKALETLR